MNEKFRGVIFFKSQAQLQHYDRTFVPTISALFRGHFSKPSNHSFWIFSFSDTNQKSVRTRLLSDLAKDVLTAASDGGDARKSPLSYMSIHGSPAGKYLPGKIKDFRPNPAHPVDPLSREILQNKCRAWVTRCRALVDKNIPVWLSECQLGNSNFFKLFFIINLHFS